MQSLLLAALLAAAAARALADTPAPQPAAFTVDRRGAPRRLATADPTPTASAASIEPAVLLTPEPTAPAGPAPAAAAAGAAGVAALRAMAPAAAAALAARAGLSPEAIEKLLTSDPSVTLQPAAGALTYGCALPLPSDQEPPHTGGPSAPAGPAAAGAAAAAAGLLPLAVKPAGVFGAGSALAGDTDPDPSQAFLLHSRAGAKHTVYLDFNGHTTNNTNWNYGSVPSSFTTPPYDRDGSPSTFNDEERKIIIDAWRYIAEDYAPFDIDVTTEEPTFLLSGGVGMRVVIGGNSLAWYNKPGVAGVADLYSFGRTERGGAPNEVAPVYVFSDMIFNGKVSVMNGKSIATTASHELGHTFGLQHHGINTPSGRQEYYGGNARWGPLMGGAGGCELTTWCDGKYPGATQPDQDDVQIISAKAPLVPDDAGGAPASAKPVALVQGSPATIDGLIGGGGDADVYSFTAAANQSVRIGLELTTRSPLFASGRTNLDSEISVYGPGPAGPLVANLTNDDGVLSGVLPPVVLPAAGTYYLSIRGTGQGGTDPYSSYGMMGAYRLKLTLGVFNSGPNFKGCYAPTVASSQQRTLGNIIHRDLATLTNDACGRMAAAAGYAWYGTAGGRDCWAGDALPEGAAAVDECFAPCAGDATQACGGAAGQLSIFSEPYDLASEYRGCVWSDIASASDIIGNTDGAYEEDQMTNDMCRGLAATKGFRYYGTTQATRCVGLNTLPKSTALAPNAACKFTCYANANQTCGGPGAISLYQRTMGPEGEALGCFEEMMSSAAKLLPTRLNPDDDPSMTPAKCRQLAAAAQLPLYGVSGAACWGSAAAALPAGAVANLTGGCGACAGGAAGGCGGASGRLSVFLRVSPATLQPRLRCKQVGSIQLPSGGLGSSCASTVLLPSDLYDSNLPVTVTPALPAGGLFAAGSYLLTVATTTATAGVSQCIVSFTVSPCLHTREFQGCYDNVWLDKDLKQDAAMTVAVCRELAVQAGLDYYSLWGGQLCSAGATLASWSTPAPSNSSCDAPCGGDASEMCGSRGGLSSVYKVDKTPPPPPSDGLPSDQGDPSRPRGWYDAQCAGAAKDYCRYVGTPPFWSCALAGAPTQYTPAGSYSEATTSAAPCTACKAGQGGGKCALCPAGSWSPAGNATVPKPSCAPCGAGTAALAPGSAGCEACAPGYGGSSCRACGAGSFSLGGNSTGPKPECAPCPSNSTTLAAGAGNASMCSACAPGFGATPCVRCAVGKFSPGGTSAQSQRPACSPCPVNSTTLVAGARSASMCTACAPGYGGSPCSLCPVGTYSVAPNATNPTPACAPCGAGLTTLGAGSTSVSACGICKPGFGGPGCRACAKGRWSAGGNATSKAPDCSPCAANATTASTGATAAGNCTLCAAGYGSATPTGSCSQCAAGTFSPGGNATTPRPACRACNPGLTTLVAGAAAATSCTACAPGYGGSPCSPCPVGRYSVASTATNPAPACAPCGAGLTTLGAGSHNISACGICKPGFGGPGCGACAKGRWSAGGNATSKAPDCSPCGANATTASTGATAAANCTLCAPGYGSPTATGSCTQCAAGTFSAGGNASTPRPACRPCSTGRTTPAAGATAAASCTVCRPGYGNASCALCVKGSFSAGGSAATPAPPCAPCPANSSTTTTGSTARAQCSVCAAGYGGNPCAICQPGFWSAGGNASSSWAKPPCIKCTTGTTSGPGATAPSACAASAPGRRLQFA